MNIAHILDSLSLGGMEKLVVELARIQKREGHKVAIFSIFSKEAFFYNEIRENKIDLFEFQKKRGFDLILFLRLIELFKKNKFDVVHTHNATANFYGALCGKIARTKVIINTRHGMGDAPFYIRNERIFKMSAIFTDKIVFVCERAKKEFIKLRLVSSNKSTVIYNGVSLEKLFAIDKNASNIKIRNELKINKNDEIVGCITRLDPDKDLETLIKAAYIVVQKFKKAKFLIIGSGSEKNKLEKLVAQLCLKDNVLFLGPRTDIGEILASFDVFSLTSLSEGVSLSILEAMAMGKAIVVTDVGGNPEVILNKRTGVLVPQKDEKTIAQAIIWFLENKELAFNMGQEAIKRAQDMFNINQMADNYEKIYKNLLNGKTK